MANSNGQREGPAAGPYELRSPSLDSQSNELYSGSPIVESYDTGEHDTEGYDSQGFDAEGFDANSYNAEGFDVDGYDAEGYDVDGFDAEGYDAEGHDVDGYNAEGLDAEGLEVEDQAMEDCNVVYHGLGDRGMGDPNMGDHDMGDYNDDIDSDDSYEFSSDEESFVFEPRSEYHPGWTKDLSPSLNPNHSTPPEVMKWVAWPAIYDSLDQIQSRVHYPLRKVACVRAALTHVDFVPLADYKFPYGAMGKLRPLHQLPNKK